MATDGYYPNPPVISVIIPVYQVLPYLRKCVDSVLRQTYPSMDIILVDDGSTDGGEDIIDNYAKADDRVRVIHQPNAGLSAARNAGLDIAVGEYVSFVDSDDWIDSEMLKTLYTAITDNDADLCTCNYQRVDENGLALPQEIGYLPDKCLSQVEAYDCLALKTAPLMTVACAKLYRKSIFQDFRYPVGRLYEDEFVIHHVLSRCARIVTIRQVLYFYLYRENSIVNAANPLKKLDGTDAYLDRYSFFKQRKDRKHMCDAARMAYHHLYHLFQNNFSEGFLSQTNKRFTQVLLRLLVCRDLRAFKLTFVYIGALMRYLFNR